jgi:eukaryotic-like serine/threonine-protein kinase
MTLLAGRLVLLEPIGEGGTGAVRRAWDLRRRRCVAAKLLPRSAYDAGPPRQVTHPHVLAVDEVLTTPHLVVLVMPLARGGTADRLLAEHGALPHDYVAVLLDHLLAGLDAVHRAGLVHGDVKPANLLLAATGSGRPHLLLADFGAATTVGETRTAATHGYLAPEAVGGAPPHARQDLYAAGVTAVELLTGRPAPAPPRGPLRPLLAALTDPDPDDRIPDAGSARAVLHALGVPEGAPWQRRPHPPYVPDRTRRQVRRQRS